MCGVLCICALCFMLCALCLCFVSPLTAFSSRPLVRCTPCRFGDPRGRDLPPNPEPRTTFDGFCWCPVACPVGVRSITNSQSLQNPRASISIEAAAGCFTFTSTTARASGPPFGFHTPRHCLEKYKHNIQHTSCVRRAALLLALPPLLPVFLLFGVLLCVLVLRICYDPKATSLYKGVMTVVLGWRYHNHTKYYSSTLVFCAASKQRTS